MPSDFLKRKLQEEDYLLKKRDYLEQEDDNISSLLRGKLRGEKSGKLIEVEKTSPRPVPSYVPPTEPVNPRMNAAGEIAEWNPKDYIEPVIPERKYLTAREHNDYGMRRGIPATTEVADAPINKITSDNYQEYFGRARELALMDDWTEAEREEAKAIHKVIAPQGLGVTKSLGETLKVQWNEFMNPLTKDDEKYPVSPYKQNVGTDWNTVYQILDYKMNPALTGMRSGLEKGLGLVSIAEAMQSLQREYFEGDEGMSKYVAQGDKALDILKAREQYAREKAPIATAAGEIAGTLGMLEVMRSAAGAVIGFTKLPQIAQSIITGAAAFGGQQAIEDLGAVASGGISTEDYLRNISASAVAGGAGSALSGVLANAGMKFIANKGLANNTLAKTVATGLAGSGFAIGNVGSQKLARDLGYVKGDEITTGQLIQDAAVGFAFGSLSYLFREAGKGFTMKEPAHKWKYFDKNMSAEEARAYYRELALKYHPDVNQGDKAAEEIFKEISAEYRLYQNSILNRASESYSKAAKSYAAGDTKAGAQAEAEFGENMLALRGAMEDGVIVGPEVTEAIQILDTVLDSGIKAGGEAIIVSEGLASQFEAGETPAPISTLLESKAAAETKLTPSETMAETLGENGKKAITAVLTDESDTIDKTQEFVQVYNASRNNEPLPATSKIDSVQRYAAEAAGINDREVTDGEQVRLRKGGEWDDGTSAVGQVPPMEEVSGRDQGGQAISKPRDNQTDALTFGEWTSPARLGIKGGSEETNIRLVEAGDTEATVKAKKIAAQNGLELVLFGDGYLHVGDVKDAQGYIDLDKGIAYVRADDPDFTSDSLVIHEVYHDKDIDYGKLRAYIDEVAPGQTRQLIEAYAQAYEMDLTGEEVAEYIFKEIVSDSMSRMNRFEGLRATEKKAEEYMADLRAGIRATSKAEPRAPTKATSESKFTYDSLISKPNMKVAKIKDGEKLAPTKENRGTVVSNALDNAKMVGKKNEDGSVSVYVDDVSKNIIVTPNSIRHGLDRRFSVNAPVAESVGEVLKNAIQINELNPRSHDVDSGYVLLGVARGESGSLYPTRFVVNRYSNELMEIDVLFALNAKKEPVALPPVLTGEPAILTDSEISIAQLLDLANKYFPDVLPEDVLRHFGHISRPKGELGESAIYSRDIFGKTESMADLRAENEALREKLDDYNKIKEQLASAKRQLTITEKPTLRKEDIRKFTKERIDYYNSAANVNDITEQMQELGDFIVQGGKTGVLDYTEVKDKAIDIAAELVQNAQELANEEYINDLSGIKRMLRSKPIYYNNSPGYDMRYVKDKARFRREHGEIADFESFRKRNFGRFTLTSNLDKRGTVTVEDLWSSLQSGFPGYFPDEIDGHYLDDASMLKHIEGVLDQLEPIYLNPFDRDMAEVIEYEANAIIDGLIDSSVRQTAPTYADRMEKKITRLEIDKAKYRDKLREVRAKRDEKIRALKDDFASRETARRERARMGKLKNSITKRSKELSTWLLKPTDKKHVMNDLQSSVARVLEAINLEGIRSYDEYGRLVKHYDAEGNIIPEKIGDPTKRTQAFIELRKQFNEIKGDLSIDPDLMGEGGNLDAVIEMSDIPIDAMTEEQLKIVDDTIKAVEAAVKTQNKLFRAGRFETVVGISEQIKSDTAHRKSPKSLIYPLDRVQRLLTLDMMTPETYFHILGPEGDNLFREYRNAQDEFIEAIKDTSEFTRGLLKEHSVHKMERAMHNVTLGGKETQLSTAQLIDLYNLTQRGEQALNHILYGGGFLVKPAPGKGIVKSAKPIPIRGITLEEISKAISYLSAEEIAIADGMRKYASGPLAERGNATTREVYGYDKFGEPEYWPIKVNRQDLKTDPIQDEFQKTSLANKGFTKQTKPNANASIVLDSGFNTFANHVVDMTTYAAYLPIQEDLTRIFNYRFADEEGTRTGTMKEVIDGVFGNGGKEYLSKLMSDVAMGIQGEREYMGGFTANYKASAIGANMRVIIQQPTAILRALNMIDAKYLAGGLIPADGQKKMVEHAPIARWKDWGYFDINTGRQLKDILFGTEGALGKIKEAAMWGAGKADSVAWGLLWNACELETQDLRKDLKVGSDEYYKHVKNRFAEIIDHTQVVDGMLQRSQFMRSSSGLKKMAGSFMGEPTKAYNMALAAIDDYKNAKDSDSKKNASKHLVSSMVALLAAGLLNAAAQSFVDAVRDNDREMKYWERWLNAFTGFPGEDKDSTFGKAKKGNIGEQFNPLQYVPYAKDIDSILDGYDVKRMDMESLQKVYRALNNFTKTARGEGRYTLSEASATLFAEASRLVGLPVANIKRDVAGIANTIAIETDNYLMMYRIVKASLNMNYSYNNSTYYGILYGAYKTDEEAYQIIYNDMIKSGYSEESIKDNMERLMKKEEEVSSVKELSQRYLTPSQQASYDGLYSEVTKSRHYTSAYEDIQTNVDNLMYALTVDNGDAATARKRIEGANISEAQYVLFMAALQMADRRNNSNKHYSQAEVEEALYKMSFSNKAKAYLWDAITGGKNNPYD